MHMIVVDNMTDDVNRKPGRETKYRPEYVKQTRDLCLLGYTDEQLADFFGVHVSTFYRWQQEYPELREAINAGKPLANAQVAASLFERAKGYEHPEDKVFCHEGKITIVPTIKRYPPDTGAAMAWLTNRERNIWKHRQEIVQNGDALAEIAALLKNTVEQDHDTE